MKQVKKVYFTVNLFDGLILTNVQISAPCNCSSVKLVAGCVPTTEYGPCLTGYSKEKNRALVNDGHGTIKIARYKTISDNFIKVKWIPTHLSEFAYKR